MYSWYYANLCTAIWLQNSFSDLFFSIWALIILRYIWFWGILISFFFCTLLDYFTSTGVQYFPKWTQSRTRKIEICCNKGLECRLWWHQDQQTVTPRPSSFQQSPSTIIPEGIHLHQACSGADFLPHLLTSSVVLDSIYSATVTASPTTSLHRIHEQAFGHLLLGWSHLAFSVASGEQ